MSIDTTMEDSDDSVSNTAAIICGSSYISGQTKSLISGPNISNSSSTSEDEYQQHISTGAGGGGGGTDDNLMIIASSCESSSSVNNNNQSEQRIRIFNVDIMGSYSRSHECSICGLEFLSGQALGGHMRRHRAIITSEDENQQQISTGAGGNNDDNDDFMIIVSSGKSSRSTNNNKQSKQKVSRILSDDYMGLHSRPHECFICGLELLSSQALGGHMRCHRVLCLDLNLTPLENDLRLF